MPIWNNVDGLYVKFGASEGDTGKAGEYKEFGPVRVLEATFDLTTLGANPVILDDNTLFARDLRIEQVVIEVETAATSGGAAVFNFGLTRTDRTTELDYDGFVAALPLAQINAAGKKVTLTTGVTGAGALVGTTLANVGLLCGDYDTAAYTAGRLRVRVYGYQVA